MRTTFSPARVTVYGIEPGHSTTIFRIVRAPDQDDPVSLNSLRSNYELTEPPRKVERSSTLIHMGISAYLKLDSARETALRFPKLGDYIAKIALTSGHGFNIARTGHPYM